MIWFSSDFHLCHDNIIKYCNRPFKNVHEMDNAIIDNVNRVVKANDQLFILGDFAFGDPWNYRKQIICENTVLVLGNHDRRIRKPRLENIFGRVEDICVLNHGNSGIVMCHYEMHNWFRKHHGFLHIFGHCHSKEKYGHEPNTIHVGVDAWNFKPVSLDEILCMRQKS